MMRVHVEGTKRVLGAAAKAGVAGMTRALAREIGSRGITLILQGFHKCKPLNFCEGMQLFSGPFFCRYSRSNTDEG